MHDQRQIVMLREEKRRLKAALNSNQAVLAAADYARVEAETRLLIGASETDKPDKFMIDLHHLPLSNLSMQAVDKRNSQSAISKILPLADNLFRRALHTGT